MYIEDNGGEVQAGSLARFYGAYPDIPPRSIHAHMDTKGKVFYDVVKNSWRSSSTGRIPPSSKTSFIFLARQSASSSDSILGGFILFIFENLNT